MASVLAQSLKSHDDFFKMYIDMIPKEIYRAGDEDDEDMNPRYFKHRKQPLTLDEKKSLSRKRKAEKYGLVNEDDQAADDDEDDDDDMDEENQDLSKKVPANLINLTLTKNKKQKVVQTNNNANNNTNNNSNKANNKPAEIKIIKNVKNNTTVLKSNHNSSNNNNHNTNTNHSTAEDLHQSLLLSNSSIDYNQNDNDDDDDMSTSISGSLTSVSSELLEFNELRGKSASKVTSTLSQNGTIESNHNHNNLIHSNSHKDTKDSKPGSKVRRLKRMLQEAEEKRNKLEALRKQGEGGQEQAKQQVWSDALIDASGSKSVSDTKKLKKALKRIDKTKEKSTKEWQARLEAVDEGKAARQEKRENNLQARKEGRPTTSAAATSGSAIDKDKNKGDHNDGEGSSGGGSGSSGGHKKFSGSSGTSGSSGSKQTIRNPLNKTVITGGHTHNSHSKSSSGGSGGSSTTSATSNHHKNTHRPGFEGKKKSNSQFLNQKK